MVIRKEQEDEEGPYKDSREYYPATVVVPWAVVAIISIAVASTIQTSVSLIGFELR